MRFIYGIVIHLYSLGIRAASILNPKAGLWVRGRRNIFQRIESEVLAKLKEGDELVWFHCASLGEFEQGRTLVEKFKVRGIKFKVLLTFFSPSGYEIRKDYEGADFVFYLPADTGSNAKRFVRSLPIRAAFFVKYEFWFNYLSELKRKNVAVFLVSGIFREDQYFFKAYGSWARKQLNCFTHFFLQDEGSQTLLNRFGFANTSVDGDTRFDRVYEVSQNGKEYTFVKLFVENSTVIVAGSTWEEDEKILAGIMAGGQVQNLKMIVVPHEINGKRMHSISEVFAGREILKYSNANQENIKKAKVLIIDNIGMLSSLYPYGELAYIGGGFDNGIHNILEAAVFGLPVVFGPDYLKFIEAVELLKTGGAFSVKNRSELEAVFNKLINEHGHLQQAGSISKNYVLNKTGATNNILQWLKSEGILKS